MPQPFYHLRPNKYVDRHLFINLLEYLNSKLSLSEHRYIGFGSYLFDDFKLIHDRLNLGTMISLEANTGIFERAKYNLPYNCIEVLNQTSTDFISGDNWSDQNSIIWFDYVSPKQLGQQFNDIATLSNTILPHDILRITINANANTLGSIDKGYPARFERLKSRISEYLPSDAVPEECSMEKYPILLLKSLHLMLSKLFTETKYDKRFILPLFSTLYQDGEHIMLTFTCIVLDNHNEENELKDFLKKIPYVNFEWEQPFQIRIPSLTLKEILDINKLLPSDTAEEQLLKNFNFIFNDNKAEVDSYISFYKYYPNFHNVNF